MLKLYGFSTSQYYNKVKLALLEKGLPFLEVLTWAGESDLSRSPLGKVPYLDTPDGPLCESTVILDYLEQQFPDAPLLPAEGYQAAKVREIAMFIDLHLEQVARPLYPEAFFGGKVSDETKVKAGALLEKGVAALAQLARFSPFVAGQSLTLADCSAVTHLPVVAATGKLIFGKDFLAGLPFDAYMQTMMQRPSVQKIYADRQTNMALLAERLKARS